MEILAAVTPMLLATLFAFARRRTGVSALRLIVTAMARPLVPRLAIFIAAGRTPDLDQFGNGSSFRCRRRRRSVCVHCKGVGYACVVSYGGIRYSSVGCGNSIRRSGINGRLGFGLRGSGRSRLRCNRSFSICCHRHRLVRSSGGRFSRLGNIATRFADVGLQLRRAGHVVVRSEDAWRLRRIRCFGRLFNRGFQCRHRCRRQRRTAIHAIAERTQDRCKVFASRPGERRHRLRDDERTAIERAGRFRQGRAFAPRQRRPDQIGKTFEDIDPHGAFAREAIAQHPIGIAIQRLVGGERGAAGAGEMLRAGRARRDRRCRASATTAARRARVPQASAMPADRCDRRRTARHTCARSRENSDRGPSSPRRSSAAR